MKFSLPVSKLIVPLNKIARILVYAGSLSSWPAGTAPIKMMGVLLADFVRPATIFFARVRFFQGRMQHFFYFLSHQADPKSKSLRDTFEHAVLVLWKFYYEILVIHVLATVAEF